MSNMTNPKVRRRVQLDFSDSPSLTEQAHKDEVSIHHIMKRYKKTGVIQHVNQYEGTYGDFTDAPGYTEAQNIIASANSMFETVPSHIRTEFGNDPGQFLKFMQNPDNRDEIEAYGLSTSHLPVREEEVLPATPPPETPATPPEPSE